MDKYVILSVGAFFGFDGDTIWGYTTSEANAKKLCDLWSTNGSKFYYIKNLSHDSRINLDGLDAMK